MELQGEFKDALRTFDNRVVVSFKTDCFDMALLDELKDKRLDIRLTEHRNRRSLNANSFLWSLVTQIADKLHTSKDEVYLLMLKSYGQSEIISVQASVDVKGFFKYYEEIGEGSVNGKEFKHYKVFKGSSEYDTHEMSILLEGVVIEAKAQGIQVLSDSEIDLLKKEWGV